MQKPAQIIALLLSLAASIASCSAGTREVFLLWQGEGPWQCQISLERGKISRVVPYMFLDKSDLLEQRSPASVACSTKSRGNSAGVHLWLDAPDGETIHFVTNRGSRDVPIAGIPAEDAHVEKLPDNAGNLLWGCGDPVEGPSHFYAANLPRTFVPPAPVQPLPLPKDWWKSGETLRLTFESAVPSDLRIRRVSHGQTGVLYLEAYSPTQPLAGKFQARFGSAVLGDATAAGSVWLSLTPRIARLSVKVESPAGATTFRVATTLIETRGPKLFVNGEPFLIKGTLPGDLPAEDAVYLRSLGINTLRGGEVVKYAEKYGFMALASIQGRKLRPLSDYKGARGREELERDMKLNAVAEEQNARVAADSPYTLISQLDNERTAIGANPLEPEGNNAGADPWSDYIKGDEGEFVRLNRILAEDWNLVKPLAPTIPLGYANESQGYLAPAFLDVYMHNTYLPRDRYAIPLAEYSRWQGGESRPFVNSEYGANRFTPESYHGGKNTPLLEKLQAWGYRQTWKTFMDAGTIGGTCYKLYDATSGTDQGTRNFGIMTADRQPKLACWELWHLWRDFDVNQAGAENAVEVVFRRDFTARDCRLTITHEHGEWSTTLGDIGPGPARRVDLPFSTKSFRWRIDYSSHGGLASFAVGGFPAAVEEADFARRLARRDAPDFLRQLMTARVLTVMGAKPPSALIDMADKEAILPVAFACTDGTVYVTALARRRSREPRYVKADIKTGFSGDVVQVDEWTGKPLSTPVKFEKTSAGIVLRAVDVPMISGPIGPRSNVPVTLPVFRISPR